MSRTILCYGDSNTFGTAPMADLTVDIRFGHDARWPSVMARALGAGFEVIAEGLPGRTTTHDDPVEGAHLNGLTVLPAVLMSHRPLDLVILKLGTNDLKPRFGVPALDIALSVARLARTVRQSTAGPDGAAPGVLVICPPPILEVGELGQMFRGGAAISRDLFPAFALVLAREGIPLVDAGRLIAASPVDGIHYAAEAQVALGLAMAETLRQHFA